MKLPISLRSQKKPKLLLVRRVVGDSMSPTLAAGQVVIALPWLRSRVGDIVIARAQGREVIKRLVAIEGEYATLHGDNPDASTDSRHYGFVSRSDIIGRVLGR